MKMLPMSRGNAGFVSRIELDMAISAMPFGAPRLALTLRLLCGWSAVEVRAAMKDLNWRTPGRRPVPATAFEPPTPPVPKAILDWFGTAPDVVCWDCVTKPVQSAGDQCADCRKQERRKVNRLLAGKDQPYTERTHRTWVKHTLGQDGSTDPLERQSHEALEAAAYREWQSRAE